jgi:hypothetical protein
MQAPSTAGDWYVTQTPAGKDGMVGRIRSKMLEPDVLLGE